MKTLYRTYNLRDQHCAASLGAQIAKWRKIVSKGWGSCEIDAIAYLEVLDRAWKKTGIRCRAAQALASAIPNLDDRPETLSRFRAFCDSMFVATDLFREPDPVAACHVATNIWRDCKFLRDKMVMIWTQQPTMPDPDDPMGWIDIPIRSGWPVALIPVDLPETGELKAADEPFLEWVQPEEVREGLLSGQRSAFDRLRLLWEAKRTGCRSRAVRPRLHGLIIGPSGSGKTHVAREFARAERLPIFELSAGSWMPNGSKSDLPTAAKIAQFVARHEHGVLYIDEIEKPFPGVGDLTSTWDRAIADELMSILDAKVTRWDAWNKNLADRFDVSFFVILSGAWQRLYEQAFTPHRLLGGDWTNLTIADGFLEMNHLPRELLNRVSTCLIEVQPPSREELCERILVIQQDLGLPEDPEEARAVAAQIIEEQKGMRGLEEYFMRRWMEHRQAQIDRLREF